MKKNEYILESLQGYTLSEDLVFYLCMMKPGDPVLLMSFNPIVTTLNYVVEMANLRAGTYDAYKNFEVTEMCKQLEDDGWIYFAKQVGLFKKAPELSLVIHDENGNDIEENERFWRYDPEWDQSENYWFQVEEEREFEAQEIEQLDVVDKKGFFHATT